MALVVAGILVLVGVVLALLFLAVLLLAHWLAPEGWREPAVLCDHCRRRPGTIEERGEWFCLQCCQSVIG